jgi:hypothetical protein
MTALLRFSTYGSNRKPGIRGVARLDVLREGGVQGEESTKGNFLTVILKLCWGSPVRKGKGVLSVA